MAALQALPGVRAQSTALQQEASASPTHPSEGTMLSPPCCPHQSLCGSSSSLSTESFFTTGEKNTLGKSTALSLQTQEVLPAKEREQDPGCLGLGCRDLQLFACKKAKTRRDHPQITKSRSRVKNMHFASTDF